MLAIFVEYSIDCAHFLPHVPAEHKCNRVHGHRYDIRLEIGGKVNRKGWIVDYAEVKAAVDPIIMKQLDHRYLNHEVEGLENPTCEHLTMWLVKRIKPLFPGLSKVEVRETDRAGVVWMA